MAMSGQKQSSKVPGFLEKAQHKDGFVHLANTGGPCRCWVFVGRDPLGRNPPAHPREHPARCCFISLLFIFVGFFAASSSTALHGGAVPPQCSPQFFGVPPGAVQAPPGKQPALRRNGTAPGKNAPCCCGVLKKRDYFYSNFPAILGKKENVKGNLFSLLFFQVFRVTVLLTQTHI